MSVEDPNAPPIPPRDKTRVRLKTLNGNTQQTLIEDTRSSLPVELTSRPLPSVPLVKSSELKDQKLKEGDDEKKLIENEGENDNDKKFKPLPPVPEKKGRVKRIMSKPLPVTPPLTRNNNFYGVPPVIFEDIEMEVFETLQKYFRGHLARKKLDIYKMGHIRRTKIIEEILSTEKNYLNGLET